MQRNAVLSLGLVAGLLACGSEPDPLEPSAQASLAAAAASGYTAVNLGTLGGTVSVAYDISPVGH
nr:hypothetical protein [Gemmatimonadales bacterium]